MSKTHPASISGVFAVTTDSAFAEHKQNLRNLDQGVMGEIKNRDEHYTEILKQYTQYISNVLAENPARQKLFFQLSVFILMFSFLQFSAILCLSINHPNIVVLLASAVEAVGSFLIFPKIIAEYLFNTSETTNVNQIISAIQTHDNTVLNGIRQTIKSDSEGVSDTNGLF